MTDINKLLKEYKTRVPHEERSAKSDTMRKRRERLRVLHETCDELFYECKLLCLTNYQKERVYFLIDKFAGNFKKLHGQAKNEEIILSFIFYVKKIENIKIELCDYPTIIKKEDDETGELKYELDDRKFEIIILRMLEVFMKEMPIIPYTTTSYDHEMLSRNGGVK